MTYSRPALRALLGEALTEAELVRYQAELPGAAAGGRVGSV
jgi:hypothetical protein